MKIGVRLSVFVACFVALPIAAHAEWVPVENVKTYPIQGTTGPELYASIGERGPKVGPTRVIAHTNFKLTWSRKYEPQGTTCVLVSAKPKLIITYTLPTPAAKLPAPIRKDWETFIAGVHRHELVHGAMIKDMVKAIEAATVGMSAPNDPECRNIRIDLTNRLAGISQSQQQKSRDFDRTELSDGGNIQQLILALVNGH